MFLLLLTLTLGVMAADAGKLFYRVQQKDHLLPEDGLLCPDQASMCSNTATCCQLASGKWGCCPFARATCCEDNVHCCPSDYSCNKNEGHCVRAINNETIPWASKEASAVSVSSSSSNDAISPSNPQICPDRLSSCSESASCCRTHSGAYRCCPYPNDVCCSNGYSCCARCSICDQLNNRCIKGFETEKWETVSASISTEVVKILQANVVVAIGEDNTTQSPLKIIRCDITHPCPHGYPCCQARKWRGFCCQHPDGVCCDTARCCPKDKRCGLGWSCV